MNVSWYSNLSVCPSFSLSICRSVKTLSTFLSIIFVILEFVCITDDTFYICMRSFHFCGCMCISMYVDVCVCFGFFVVVYIWISMWLNVFMYCFNSIQYYYFLLLEFLFYICMLFFAGFFVKYLCYFTWQQHPTDL